MNRDTRGLVLGVTGATTFLAGVLLWIDLLYFGNLPAARAVPSPGLVAPNLVFGGYALVEVGRYVATDGGSRESRYYGDRLSVVTGREPATLDGEPTTATGAWLAVLLGAMAGQLLWAASLATPLAGSPGADALRYGSALAAAIAVHYDVEYVASRAGWGGRRRWVLGVLVVPVNLLVTGAYLIRRRDRLDETDSDGDGGPAARTTDGRGRGDESGAEAPSGAGSESGLGVVVPVAIAVCALAWVAVIASDGITVGRGGVVGAAVVAVWVTLPLATYLDAGSLRGNGWEPRRAYWAIGTAVPGLCVVVAAAYLLRRYETARAGVRADGPA